MNAMVKTIAEHDGRGRVASLVGRPSRPSVAPGALPVKSFRLTGETPIPLNLGMTGGRPVPLNLGATGETPVPLAGALSSLLARGSLGGVARGIDRDGRMNAAAPVSK